MTKSTKWLCVFLATMLVASFLVSGCGKNASENGQTTQPSENQSSTTKAAETTEVLKPVTLKWVMGGPGKQKDSDRVWALWNEKLQKEYLPNTTVEFEIIPMAEYKEKWGLMMTAGEKVDIAWTGYVMSFSEEISKGAYLPLDELMDQYAPGIKEDVPSWVLKYGQANGVTYSIPNYQMMNDMRVGMMVQKELADKYIDVEKAKKVFYDSVTEGQFRNATQAFYDEIELYLKALKDNGELQKGFSPASISAINNGMLNGIVTNLGVLMRLPNKGEKWDFTLYPSYEMPEVKLENDVFHDWYNKGYIRQDYVALSAPLEDAGKKDGYTAWFHTYYDGESERKSKGYGFDIEMIPMEPNYYVSRLSASTATTIPRTSLNPERAMQVIQLMHTDEGAEIYNMLVWGIEGEHYEKISDNRVRTLHYDGSQSKQDQPYGLFKWVVGNIFNLWSNQSDPEGWIEYVEELHNNAITTPIAGFAPDTSEIMNEVAQIKAVKDQYKNIWAFPNYEALWLESAEKQKAAGMDKVIEVLQKQLDEYIRANGIQ